MEGKQQMSHDIHQPLQLLTDIKNSLLVIEKDQQNKFSHIYQQNRASKCKLEDIKTEIDSKFNDFISQLKENQIQMNSNLAQDLNENLVIPIKNAMNELLMNTNQNMQNIENILQNIMQSQKKQVKYRMNDENEVIGNHEQNQLEFKHVLNKMLDEKFSVYENGIKLNLKHNQRIEAQTNAVLINISKDIQQKIHQLKNDQLLINKKSNKTRNEFYENMKIMVNELLKESKTEIFYKNESDINANDMNNSQLLHEVKQHLSCLNPNKDLESIARNMELKHKEIIHILTSISIDNVSGNNLSKEMQEMMQYLLKLMENGNENGDGMKELVVNEIGKCWNMFNNQLFEKLEIFLGENVSSEQMKQINIRSEEIFERTKVCQENQMQQMLKHNQTLSKFQSKFQQLLKQMANQISQQMSVQENEIKAVVVDGEEEEDENDKKLEIIEKEKGVTFDEIGMRFVCVFELFRYFVFFRAYDGQMVSANVGRNTKNDTTKY